MLPLVHGCCLYLVPCVTAGGGQAPRGKLLLLKGAETMYPAEHSQTLTQVPPSQPLTHSRRHSQTLTQVPARPREPARGVRVGARRRPTSRRVWSRASGLVCGRGCGSWVIWLEPGAWRRGQVDRMQIINV